jgi:hypothetical protein
MSTPLATLVETMARAVLDAHDWTLNDKEDGEPSGWDTLTEDWKEVFCRMALAALKAMREPTDTMLCAGQFESPVLEADELTDTWQAMIDAAIREGGQ